jgi:ATP-dependent Clp protease, protease subunit
MQIKQEVKNQIPTLAEKHYFLFNKDFDSLSTGEAITFILERNFITDNKLRPSMIKMIINSPGGNVNDCFALIDTMKGSKIPVYTYGLGTIASCGLMTFIAGERGHRYVTRNTSILSHQYTWGTHGKEHELMSTITEFNNTSDRILKHYKKCTGLSEKEIKKYLLPPHDVWLTAQEAVKYGIADSIVDFY